MHEKPHEKERVENSVYWGNCTPIESHKQTIFRYLVHAFNQFNQILSIQKGNHNEAQAIDLQATPERLNERFSLSTSLIDEAHTGSWGPGGLVIRSPKQNVRVVSPVDAAVDNINQALRFPIDADSLLSPEELLSQTNPASHNEVVVVGRDESGSQIALEGFFVMVDADGDYDRELFHLLEEQSKRLQLSLVKCELGNFKEEGCSDETGCCNYAGKQFVLFASYAPERFEVRTGMKTYFVDFEELHDVLMLCVERKYLSSTQVQEVAKAYKEARLRKLKPVIADDGGKYYSSFVTGVGTRYDSYSFAAGVAKKVEVSGNRRTAIPITPAEYLSALKTLAEHEPEISDAAQSVITILENNTLI